MPKAITAGTGMDAFAHCLEAFCSPFYHPLGQGIALEGMRLVHENLCRAYAEGGDLEARAHMMAAASMGATAFQKGLGAIHALEPPGGRRLRHPPRHHQRLRHALRARHEPPGGGRPAGAGRRIPRASAGGYAGFHERVLELRETLGIPRTLGAMGVSEDRLDDLAAMALEDPTAGGNPVPMTAENTRALLEACF